ncbi:MAG: DUF354 domain-containing protein [Bacteroidota bacterium]
MNLLIDIGHPAHVHLFKDFAERLRDKGHVVYFSAKQVESIVKLLDVYGYSYTSLGRKHNGSLLKYLSSSVHLVKLWSLVVSKKIDIGIGVSGLLPFVSGFSKLKSICLDDDDSVITPLFARSIRNADAILTPSALKDDSRGKNHITYNGYHELAYLHPDQFKPDPDVLKVLGLKEGEKFFLLRFNAFKAHHDVGEYGLSMEQKKQLIKLLEPHGRVFVSSEMENMDFADYKINLPPEKIHSLLYYATMFIGDSQTMTSEAAVLGIPALKCNTFAGRLSIPDELEHKYGLCYSFKPDNFDQLLIKAAELLNQETLHEEFHSRRQKMLSEKINVTAFLEWFIENFQEGKQIMKENPDYQYQFK